LFNGKQQILAAPSNTNNYTVIAADKTDAFDYILNKTRMSAKSRFPSQGRKQKIILTNYRSVIGERLVF